jgi:hypothetical protein
MKDNNKKDLTFLIGGLFITVVVFIATIYFRSGLF